MTRLAHVARTLLAGLLLVGAPALARAPATPPPPKPVTPTMWEVSDSDTRIVVFGTVHLLPAGVQWLKPPIVQRLDAADELVLETVIPADPRALAGDFLRLGRGSGLPPLVERVAPADRPKLDQAIATLKPGPLDAFDTWYAALMLSNLQTARLGLDPRRGVEAVLTARAELLGKKVSGLETPDEQLRLFDAAPEAEQRKFLSQTLADLSTMRADLDTTVADWLAGRKDELARRINEDMSDTPALSKLLLDDRNARWAAWIAERMKRPGTVFLAVGAGHLAGPNSLIERLPAYGLTPVPVVEALPVPSKRQRR